MDIYRPFAETRLTEEWGREMARS